MMVVLKIDVTMTCYKCRVFFFITEPLSIKEEHPGATELGRTEKRIQSVGLC